jgi:hypothetical protein
VELADGLLSLLVRGHLDERKPACAARRHVAHDADIVDLPRTAEEFGELILGSRIR